MEISKVKLPHVPNGGHIVPVCTSLSRTSTGTFITERWCTQSALYPSQTRAGVFLIKFSLSDNKGEDFLRFALSNIYIGTDFLNTAMYSLKIIFPMFNF